MSTILTLMCKQASYPGRGAAIGTVAGGLAGYGLADEDQRVEGAALGAAAGGLGGYGLGRAYLHRPLGPAVTDKARLLGAGGEGAEDLAALFADHPLRASLLERAHGGSAAPAAPTAATSELARLVKRRPMQGALLGAGVGGATGAAAADDGSRLEGAAFGALGGGFIGGVSAMPHVRALAEQHNAQMLHDAWEMAGTRPRKLQKLRDTALEHEETAEKMLQQGMMIGAPTAAAVGALHGIGAATRTAEREKAKTASILDAIFKVH